MMGFEAFHPALNLLFFVAAIWGTCVLNHPAFLAVSLLASGAYSIHRCGARAVRTQLVLVPCVSIFTLWYACYHHFGMTVLAQNFIGNNITLESLTYGLVLGLTAAAVILWMLCVFSVFTADKVVYLLGRISPRLGLFFAISLRFLPRIRAQARHIHTARCGLGRGMGDGSAWQRIKNGLAIFSMLISWSIGALATLSDSMRSRGSALRGRTAFSLYRFDNRDRVLAVTMTGCVMLTILAYVSGLGMMAYDPKLLWNPMDASSAIFLAGYAGLCLLPLCLEVGKQLRFQCLTQRL